MNKTERDILGNLTIHIEYIKEKVTSLDKRVAIQNGRVTDTEKKVQHIDDTINKDTISKQITEEFNERNKEKSRRNVMITGTVVAIVTVLINIVFRFI